MTSGEIKLVQFALWTLDCLEESEDWSADTLDAIAQDARDLGLADHDPNGMFRVTDVAVSTSSVTDYWRGRYYVGN